MSDHDYPDDEEVFTMQDPHKAHFKLGKMDDLSTLTHLISRLQLRVRQQVRRRTAAPDLKTVQIEDREQARRVLSEARRRPSQLLLKS